VAGIEAHRSGATQDVASRAAKAYLGDGSKSNSKICLP
jgi:hypothetical protein